MTRKSALFFLHNYNDIDHVTPVIDALVQSGGWDCSVVFYPHATHGSVNFETDWRFAWLREAHNIPVARLEDIDPASRWSSRLFRLRDRITSWCDATPFMGRLMGRDLRGLLPWFLASRVYDHALGLWLRRLAPTGRALMDRYRPDVVAMDWGLVHAMVTPVSAEAERRGVPVVQLPHGAWTYEGIFSHRSQQDPKKLRKPSRLPVIPPTVMAVDNVYKGQRSVAQGVAEDCLRLMGLARFTPQWHERLAALPRGTAALPVADKPRVVWFPAWLMASDREGVKATIAVMERYADRLDIAIKVHTRNPAHEEADYGRLLSPGSAIRLVANEEESFAVTRWADMVLITQSSIVYDAFLMEKPVVYLKYTHDFDCIWEADGAGEVAENAADLDRHLAALAEGRFRPSYAPVDTERFLRHAVTAGLKPAEVLPGYVALFDDLAARRAITVGKTLTEGVADWRASGRPIRDAGFVVRANPTPFATTDSRETLSA